MPISRPSRPAEKAAARSSQEGIVRGPGPHVCCPRTEGTPYRMIKATESQLDRNCAPGDDSHGSEVGHWLLSAPVAVRCDPLPASHLPTPPLASFPTCTMNRQWRGQECGTIRVSTLCVIRSSVRGAAVDVPGIWNFHLCTHEIHEAPLQMSQGSIHERGV